MERKVSLIPYEVVEQMERVNENPKGVELTQEQKIEIQEMLLQELETAKATYFEYSENRVYYEEARDEEIKQTYYKDILLDRKSIHDLLEKHMKIS